MALQLFDQVDPKVAKLVKNLQELGREYLRKYPESTKGRFTFFPHTNQPIAQHLKYLDSSVNNADELMGTLRRLFNGFSDTGTLLNDAYDLVLQSRLYLAVIIKNNTIFLNLPLALNFTQNCLKRLRFVRQPKLISSYLNNFVELPVPTLKLNTFFKRFLNSFFL